jgi:hypothetical protein
MNANLILTPVPKTKILKDKNPINPEYQGYPAGYGTRKSKSNALTILTNISLIPRSGLSRYQL